MFKKATKRGHLNSRTHIDKIDPVWFPTVRKEPRERPFTVPVPGTTYLYRAVIQADFPFSVMIKVINMIVGKGQHKWLYGDENYSDIVSTTDDNRDGSDFILTHLFYMKDS